jgi:hypothetical protein
MSDDASRVPATEEQTLAGTHATLDRPAATHAALARGQTVGRYLILTELGRGTMGAVYDAYDADLDRRVALKLIAEPLRAGDAQRQRLLGEAQLMAKISHSNVVSVFDVGVWQDRLYVAMELVEGITLDQWCAAAGRRQPEVLDVFSAAGAGLAAAHDAGVVHRDFKPSNVLVSADRRVRVADFGIAQHGTSAPTAGPDADAPAASRGVGTPAYMSPEQWARAPVDARSDQFSYCVALFEAVFGKRPFAGNNALELAAAVSLGRIVGHDLRRADPRVRAVIVRGLAVAPTDRHPSMHALVEALRAARRPRPVARVAVLAALAVAGSGAWFALRSPAPDMCGTSEQVAAQWSDAVQRTIRVDEAEVTPSYAQAQREALVAGLDRYAQRWNELSRELCQVAAAAPADALVRSRSSCVEDRFRALTGTIAALRDHPIDPTRVDAALSLLPDLEACTGSAADWEPVPSDPEQARAVAALRDRLIAVRIERRAGRSGGDVAAMEAILAEAEATGFPNLVARANIELAAHYNEVERSADEDAAVARALVVAAESGDDLAMASAINRLLLCESTVRLDADELRRWTSLGDAIARRAGLRTGIRGDLHNNLGLALRARRDLDGAMLACHDAEAAYAEDDGADGLLVTRARINCVGTLVRAGRHEEARIEAERVLTRIDELQSPTSPENITAIEHVAAARLYTGDRRGSVVMLEEALRRRMLVTGARGRRTGKLFVNVALARAVTGDLDGARAAADQARVIIPGDAAALAVAEVVIAAQRPDPTELRRALDAARALPALEPEHTELVTYMDACTAVANGQPRRAMALLEPVCGTGEPHPPLTLTTCRGAALVAAVVADDREATAVWTSRLEQTLPTDHEDRLTYDVARAAASGRSDPAVLAELRGRLEAFVASTHRDHPIARLLAAGLEHFASSAPPSRP